ncbi:hypothetical protein D3C71_1226600 [compost metagenome]
MKRPQEQPMAIRTLMNWKLYRSYIKRYQDTNHELFERLLRYTADCGFNKGIEQFTLEENTRNLYAKKDKEKQLSRYADMSHTSLEQMLEQQEKAKQLAELQKTWVYDPNWKPSANEILRRGYLPTFEENFSNETFYRIYNAYDKGSFVVISAVKGYRTEVYVGTNEYELKDSTYLIFKTLAECVIHQASAKQVKRKKAPNKPIQVDIEHVKKAMGIDKPTNNRINNIPDDIF